MRGRRVCYARWRMSLARNATGTVVFRCDVLLVRAGASAVYESVFAAATAFRTSEAYREVCEACTSQSAALICYEDKRR